MNRTPFAVFSILTVLLLTPIVTAQPETTHALGEVAITADSTQLKVGNDVLGEVKQGDRFKVLAEAPGWYYVQVESQRGDKLGWVSSSAVRWIHPVFAWVERGTPKLALDYAASDYEKIRAQFDESAPATLDALNRLGLAKLACGEAAAAVEDFRQVLQQRQRVEGSSAAGVAEALNNLGVALYHAGKYTEAHPLLKQALQLRRMSLGASHTESLRSAINLANFESLTQTEPSEWELFDGMEEALQEKLLSGAAAGSPTSADLLLQRETRILHPTLALSFSAPGYAGEPQIERAIPATLDAAWWLSRLGMLTGVLEYFEKSAAIHARLAGKNAFRSALAMANMGGMPRFPFSLPELIPSEIEPGRVEKLQAALTALKPLEDGNELQLASVHHNLGICLLSDSSRAAQGLEHLQQALDVFQRQLPRHPRTALAHETLGLAAYIVHDFETAATQFGEAQAIYGESLGESCAETMAALNLLGVAHYQLDDFSAARSLIEKAWSTRKRALGAGHQDSLRSMNDLAVVLSSQGDYLGARKLFEHCIDLLKQSPEGENEWLAQQVEANLWVVRLQIGDFAPATAYFESVLRSEDTYAHRSALANLATIARLQGRFADARTYLERALELSPMDLSLMNELGVVAREQGDLNRAAEILTYVVAQRAQDQFPDNTDVAFSLTSLAIVEQRLGRLESARQRLRSALRLYQTELGNQNPRTTEVLRVLGRTELLAGDSAAARQYLSAALDNKLRLAESILPSLSEAEALAYVVAFDERDLMLEASAVSQSDFADYEVVWQTRGIATRALSPRRSELSNDPKIRQLQIDLSVVRKELSKIILAFHDSFEFSMDEPAVVAQELGEKKERLERELAAALQASGDESARELVPDAKLQDLLEALPADVAVVDFLRVHHVVGQAGWHYEAFVLRAPRDSPDLSTAVHRVSLGSADDIDAAIERFREQIVSGRGAVDGRDPAGVVRSLVWEKLEPHFDGARAVIVIPDGSLTAVPWYALPASVAGEYLIEEYAIGTAAFPHQILELLQPASSELQQVVLAGGIDYSTKPAEDRSAATESQSGERGSFKAAPTRGEAWTLLPATLDEVRDISKLANADAVLLQGTDANETRLMQEMPNSRFIHLATHGFFADPSMLSATLRDDTHDQLLTEVQMIGKATQSPTVTSLESVMGRNPLVLSGLVLAGASLAAETNEYGAPIGEDGILTAEEVAALDLHGTELVVLSACETGLGKLAGGEGVFGLQRSFALSGARCTISSLWKVDDAATAALMSEFYRNLWIEKLPKLEALRQAQLWMHRAPLEQHMNTQRGKRLVQNQVVSSDKQLPPYYWAAFILSGDWQ